MAEPVTFTRLIWDALLRYLIFAEFPDHWTWIGGAMIVAATSYISHREASAKIGRTKISDWCSASEAGDSQDAHCGLSAVLVPELALGGARKKTIPSAGQQ